MNAFSAEANPPKPVFFNTTLSCLWSSTRGFEVLVAKAMCMAKFEVRYGIPEFLAGAPIMTSGNRVEGWGAVDGKWL